MVGVVIANYNHGKYIKHAIKSVLQQSYTGLINIYIIDDCSTDDSISVIKELMSKTHHNRKIHLAQLDKKYNISYVRNCGLSQSIKDDNKYTLILDADDTIKSFKVERFLPYFDDNAVAVVYDDYETLDEATQIVQNVYKEPFCHHRILKNCILHNSVLIRNDALKECGLYDIDMEVAEDWELWIRISRHYKIVHIPEIHTTVRIASNNTTKSIPSDIWHKNWKLIHDRYSVGN